MAKKPKKPKKVTQKPKQRRPYVLTVRESADYRTHRAARPLPGDPLREELAARMLVPDTLGCRYPNARTGARCAKPVRPGYAYCEEHY